MYNIFCTYECYEHSVDYLHRAGRTARFGKKGKVCSLVGKRDTVLAIAIERAISRNEPLDLLSSDKRDYLPGGVLAHQSSSKITRNVRINRSAGSNGHKSGSSIVKERGNHHQRARKSNEAIVRRGLNRGKKVVTSSTRGSGAKVTRKIVDTHERFKRGHNEKLKGKGKSSSSSSSSKPRSKSR